ncbi:MAG: hypothetical protein WKG07_07430 [Hymenobacter sp.]
MAQAIARALDQGKDADWRTRTDDYLATISWDLTWQNMVDLMQQRLAAKPGLNASGQPLRHKRLEFWPSHLVQQANQSFYFSLNFYSPCLITSSSGPVLPAACWPSG